MVIEHEKQIQGNSGYEEKFDAILVRGYWLSQRGSTSPVKTSLRSHLLDRAVTTLYHNGIVDNIILTVGHVWGNGYPSVAEVMKGELVQKYRIPERSIHIVPEALNTDDETALFLKLADENEWKELVDLNYKTHSSAKGTYATRGRYAEPIYAEEILIQDDPRVQNLVRRLLKSKYERNFKLYELWKKPWLMISPDYKLLKKFSKLRDKKGDLSVPFSFGKLRIDKYEL